MRPRPGVVQPVRPGHAAVPVPALRGDARAGAGARGRRARHVPRHPPRPRPRGACATRRRTPTSSARRRCRCRADVRERMAAVVAEGYPRVPTMLTADPPEHTRYRRLVTKAFTPKVIAEMEPTIRAITTRLIDSWIDRGAIEFVDGLRRAAAGRGHRPRAQRARRAPGRLQAVVGRLDRRHRHQPRHRRARRRRARRERVPALLRRAARAAARRAAGRPAHRPAATPASATTTRTASTTTARSTCRRC